MGFWRTFANGWNAAGEQWDSGAKDREDEREFERSLKAWGKEEVAILMQGGRGIIRQPMSLREAEKTVEVWKQAKRKERQEKIIHQHRMKTDPEYYEQTMALSDDAEPGYDYDMEGFG